jgi:hypothetical protein
MSEWEPCVGASDDWFTPAYIFDALGCTFDLDVAAPLGGAPHVPAARSLSERGLETPWLFDFVWMNAPFGGRNGLAPWLKKFVRHGNGIALTPDRTSAPWFQTAARAMTSILFLSPKVKFERPDGAVGKSPGSGTALLAIGSAGNEALCRARHLGLWVRPL